MKKTKTVLHPTYYTEFACTGPECEYSCCQSWRIYIDKGTYLKYKQITDPEFVKDLPQKLKRVRDRDPADWKYAVIQLDDDGRCRFLTPDRLCAIQKKFGEDYLCNTCRSYPRFYSYVNGTLEASTSLSCQAAAELVLTNPDPIEFKYSEIEFGSADVKYTDTAKRFDAYLQADNIAYLPFAADIRECCIDIIQERKYSISSRLLFIGMMLKKIADLHEQKMENEIPQILSSYKSAIESGELPELAENLTKNEDAVHQISQYLYKNVFETAAKQNQKYKIFSNFLDNVNAVLENLGEIVPGESDVDEVIYEFISERVKKYFPKFLETRGYMFEHYFVNYFFSTLFPFNFIKDGLTVYDHMIVLAEQFMLLRLLLCCGMDSDQEITDEHALIVFISRAELSVHSVIPKVIADWYKANGMDSLAHMSFLLR